MFSDIPAHLRRVDQAIYERARNGYKYCLTEIATRDIESTLQILNEAGFQVHVTSQEHSLLLNISW